MIGGLLLLFQFSTALNLFSPSLVLTPIIDDFGISRGEAGFLLGLVIITQAVFSLPGSYLAVRFGLKKVFGLGWLMCGVAVLAPLADSFGAMLGLRVALGLGTAILITAVGPLVMQWFRPRELAVMYGAMLVTFTLGVTLSLFATAPLAEALDWQRALGLEGGVLLIGAVLWIFFGKATGDVEKFETRLSLGGMRRVLFEKNTLLLVLALIGPTAFYVGFTSWLPTYYHQELGYVADEGGIHNRLATFRRYFWCPDREFDSCDVWNEATFLGDRWPGDVSVRIRFLPPRRWVSALYIRCRNRSWFLYVPSLRFNHADGTAGNVSSPGSIDARYDECHHRSI